MVIQNGDYGCLNMGRSNFLEPVYCYAYTLRDNRIINEPPSLGED